MTVINHQAQGTKVESALNALSPYLESHPRAKIDVRPRYESFLGIRIIDPDFTGMDWMDREPEIWNLLETLDDDVSTSITLLVLLTPKEAEHSGANLEFEDPVSSEI